MSTIDIAAENSTAWWQEIFPAIGAFLELLLSFVTNYSGHLLLGVIVFLGFLEALRLILKTSVVAGKFRWVREFLAEDSINEKMEHIELALKRLGVMPYELDAVSTSKKIGKFGGIQRWMSENELEQLLQLLARHTYRLSFDSIYGRETPVTTSYYISTMEASLDPDECLSMASYLYKLYLTHLDDIKRIDFVLARKNGNQMLAKQFADLIGATLVICKAESDRSYLKPEVGAGRPLENIEGMVHLQKRAVGSSHPLCGVVVDCNCSGGSSLRSAVSTFNNALRDHDISDITPIDTLLMLFRADNELEKSEFRQRNARSGIRKAFWYFDCNESVKSKLYEIQSKGEREVKALVKEISESVILKGDIDI